MPSPLYSQPSLSSAATSSEGSSTPSTQESSSLNQILSERGNRYGRFEVHAKITWDLKNVISDVLGKKPYRFLEPDQLEALSMICHKLGRILAGDPNYADSWLDIAGYAKLVADRLERDQNGEQR
jgi:hypothetical protein